MRIGTVMTKIRTQDRPVTPEVDFKDAIIDQSRRKYYLPVEKVQEMIRHRHHGSRETFSPLVPPSAGVSSKERAYDEF